VHPEPGSALGRRGAAVMLGRRSRFLASCSAAAGLVGSCGSDAAARVGADAHQATALSYSSVGNG